MPPSWSGRSVDLTLVEKAAPERAGRDIDWSVYMARAQGGDRDAYRRLLEAIAPYLRRLAARHLRNPSDIEETVQEILLTVHAVRHTYDPARPLGPWLVAIANRRVVDALRRRGRADALETAQETFPPVEPNYCDERSDAYALREAVARLPHAQREAIELLKLKQMSLKEAAAASGMSVTALKVATHRALKSLRKLLGLRRETT
jgi:RNA polymerase sigma-70 factor (ECF subfamily)